MTCWRLQDVNQKTLCAMSIHSPRSERNSMRHCMESHQMVSHLSNMVGIPDTLKGRHIDTGRQGTA